MTKRFKIIPRKVIEGAVSGNIDDLQFVLRYFSGYITHLASHPFNDEYGNAYMCLDEDMRQRLEAKLVSSIILGFEIKSS